MASGEEGGKKEKNGLEVKEKETSRLGKIIKQVVKKFMKQKNTIYKNSSKILKITVWF